MCCLCCGLLASLNVTAGICPNSLRASTGRREPPSTRSALAAGEQQSSGYVSAAEKELSAARCNKVLGPLSSAVRELLCTKFAWTPGSRCALRRLRAHWGDAADPARRAGGLGPSRTRLHYIVGNGPHGRTVVWDVSEW